MMTMMYYIWGWQVEQCWLDWKCGVAVEQQRWRKTKKSNEVRGEEEQNSSAAAV